MPRRRKAQTAKEAGFQRVQDYLTDPRLREVAAHKDGFMAGHSWIRTSLTAATAATQEGNVAHLVLDVPKDARDSSWRETASPQVWSTLCGQRHDGTLLPRYWLLIADPKPRFCGDCMKLLKRPRRERVRHDDSGD